MSDTDNTTWRLVALEGFSGRLDLTLVVDTQAAGVVEAIEEAAEAHAIVLERIEDVDEQAEIEEPAPPPATTGIGGLVVTGLADDRHR